MSTNSVGLKRPSRGGHLAKPVTVDGVRYPSISAAARAFGIDPLVVIPRLRIGWPLRRALTVEPRSIGRGTAVSVGSREYRSVREACRALGAPYRVIIDRLHRGWDTERAFAAPVRNRDGTAKRLTIGGKRYESVAAAARAFGVDPAIARERIRTGWSPKKALRTPVTETLNGHTLTVRGQRYRSLAAAARAHGLAKDIAMERIRRGWKRSDAVTAPLKSRGRPITFQGRRFASIEAACAGLRVSLSSLTTLRDGGMSIACALEELLERENGRGKLLVQRERFKARVREQGNEGLESLQFRGVRYTSTSALAHAFGVLPVTVRGRLRLGWTVEQALGLAERPKLVRNIAEVHVAGEVFPSMSAAARRFGVPWSVARYRLQIGATPEQAFGLSPFEARVARTGTHITVCGEEFASISAACRRWKKNPALIQQRIARGESPEQAFDLEPPPLEHAAVVVGGRPFRFLAGAARHFQVPAGRLRALIEEGLDPQVAVERILSSAGHKNATDAAPAGLSR